MNTIKILLCILLCLIFGYLFLDKSIDKLKLASYESNKASLEKDTQEFLSLKKDLDIIKARKEYVQISNSNKQIRPLLNYCLNNETSKPILISDMTSCKDKALKHLGYTSTYSEIKNKALQPLSTEYNLKRK